MSGLTLRSQIGNSTVAHVSLPVYMGKMQQTVEFFVKDLGWKEDQDACVAFEGGEARFVQDSTQVRVQLTDLSDYPDPSELEGVHLALHVRSAAVAALGVQEWAKARGIEVQCEPADETNDKWFVTMEELLPWDIEFVTYETPLF